jgi:hypothetical protein
MQKLNMPKSFSELIIDLLNNPQFAQNHVQYYDNFSLTRLTNLGTWGHSNILTHMDISEKIGAVRALSDKTEKWKAENIHQITNSSLIDATMLYTISNLFDGKIDITPSTLFDLGTFVQCAIMNDHIYAFENKYTDNDKISSCLGDSFKTLRMGDFDICDHRYDVTLDDLKNASLQQAAQVWLDGIFSSVRTDWTELGEAGEDNPVGFEAASILKSWQQFLGEELQHEEFFRVKILNQTWPSIAPQYMKEAIETDDWFTDGHQVSPYNYYDLIHNANLRARFNMEVAQQIGLTYFSSAYRLPYQRALFGRGAGLTRTLPVIAAIDNVYRRYAEGYYYRDHQPLTLPFFLSAVLQRASKPADIPEIIADLRYECLQLRQGRAELEKALAENRPKEIEKLRKVLSGEYEKTGYGIAARMSSAGFLALLPLMATTLPTTLYPLIFILAAGTSVMHSKDWDRMVTHFLRPTWLSVSDTASQARAMLDAYPEIAKIWNLADDKEERYCTVLKRFAAMR